MYDGRVKANFETGGHINEESKIWRYMDITKLISLLHKKALFFSRSDKLSDPFEGFLTKLDVEDLNMMYEGNKNLGENTEILKQLEGYIAYMKDIPKEGRKYFFVNCWHAKEYESMSMWNSYGNSNNGIAIQTNCKKLIKCLEEGKCKHKEETIQIPKIYIETMKYVDPKKYRNGFSSQNWNRKLLFKKLENYSDEQEIRALIDLSGILFGGDENGYNYCKIVENYGIYIYIEPKDLIEKIFVCPSSPNWVYDVVASIAEKYDIGKEKVQKSSLASEIYNSEILGEIQKNNN